MLRRTTIVLGTASILAAAAAGIRIERAWCARSALDTTRAPDDIAALPPLESTIAGLYEKPPMPGRRVLLTGPILVLDTIRTVRPIATSTDTIPVPEGLIFLADSLTGHRIVLLRRLDEDGSAWVELTPLPRSVSVPHENPRSTPLAHLAHFWQAGWSDLHGPGGFVWLGLDSAIIRTRDIVNPDSPPYRLARVIRSGSFRVAKAPRVWDMANILLAVAALACALGAWRSRKKA
ncbi:MAG TPA: hypothetical protein PK384_06345 [Candidatus Latescibacteria bacterium]|nr:hypothetical protein [Candidatus Latescibacterota bacterium]HRU24361.1 hypothetical protein [Candidatus Latescibacterota bacterium]